MVDLLHSRPTAFWYFVGLITSDGCLSRDGSHISLTSKDREFLEKLKTTLGIPNNIGRKIGGTGSLSFQIQMGSKALYSLLLDIGLKPNKSLTLGALKIPMPYCPDFLRGMIDGDGCIRTWIHSSNRRRQWALPLYSSSPIFALWLKSLIEGNFAVRGRLHVYEAPKRHPRHIIKFGKLSAKVILRACYYPECLAMPRKWELARRCIQTPNGVTKYGNVVAGVVEPADTRDLKSRGRKRP